MKKVILVPHPHYRWEDGRLVPDPYLPLGLVSIATVLRGQGYQVEIFDINVHCVDMSLADTALAILDRKPDVIGFSTIWSQYPVTLKLVQHCKAWAPSVSIMLGGTHATLTAHETVMAFPYIDVIVRGESEQIISEVVQAIPDRALLSKVPGVTYRQDGSWVEVPGLPPRKARNSIGTLDAVSSPDYSLYPHVGRLRSVPIELGRGCTYSCSFCASKAFWRGRCQLRSIESAIKILSSLVHNHGCRRFAFLNDTLTSSRSWLMKLCEVLMEEQLDITWECSTRIDRLDDELLGHMAGAGCSRILVGIETGSQRLQAITHKRLDLDQALHACQAIARHDMAVLASFVMGFPQETKADVGETLRLMAQLRFAGRGDEVASLQLLVPLLGSQIYEEHHDRLGYDGYHADLVISHVAEAHEDLITAMPAVFAPYYYVETPHLPREFLIKTTHLFRNLWRYPFTMYILGRSQEVDYPGYLLNQLTKLEMPLASQVQFQDVSGVLGIVPFLESALVEAGLRDHYVMDVLRYEAAVHSTSGSSEGLLVRAFRYDVEQLIEDIAERKPSQLPSSLKKKVNALMFTLDRSGVQTTRLPPSVAISLSDLSSSSDR